MRLPKDEHCSILKVVSPMVLHSEFCREKTLQILMILALLLLSLIQQYVPCAATLLLTEQIKSHHGFTLKFESL